MRIPVYNAEGSVTREAPGRSIRSRMDATPFIQAELRKGEVLQSAAQAAGEYANARYKVQVENDLNEAMLGAQETLRTRRDELAKSPNYNRVLDGDNPIWNQETSQIKNELRKKVGKNVYALTQFDAKFGQIELQNRFQLRNDIDRKIAAVAAANQAQLYVNGENTIANSDNLSEIDFIIAGVKLNGDRLVQLGLGKGETLSKQEYAMVFRGTDRALTNFISEQDNSILTLHKIRKVLETEDAGEKLDPDLQVDPEGQKIYHLLRSLKQGDRNKLLKRAGGTATFVDGPTLYEQQQNLVTEGIGKQANDTVTTLIDNVTNGYEPSAAEIETLSRQYEAATQTQKPAELAKLKAKVLYFETVIDVAAETKRMNGNQLVTEIDKRQDKENKTQTDINVLEYLKSRQSALIKGVNEDAMAWANDQGTITMEPVDYGNFQTQEGQPNPEFVEALQDRLEKSSIVQSVYQRTSLALAPVIMTKAETAQVSRMLNEMGPEQDLAFISSVQAALGPDASRLLFAQLGDDAPQMSFLGGLYASGFGKEAAIDIAAGLEFEDQVKISSITNTAGDRMNLDFIMADVFAGYPDTYQAGLDPVIIQSVEAILTYRVKNRQIDISAEGDFSQDDLRKVFSYVMGGSKDGETGGIGTLDNDNESYYHRPDGVTDDQFSTALVNNLGDLFPDGKVRIDQTLDSNFTVQMVDQTDQREPIYQLYVTDGSELSNPLTTQAVGVGDDDPYQFTYSMLIQMGQKKELAAKLSDAQELAKKQARNPELKVEGVDPELLAQAQADLAVEQADLAVEQDALQEASNAQPVGSVGGQVVEGQSTGITGGATDAEIEQLMGTDNAPETATETATTQDDEAFDQVIEGNKYKGEMKNGKRNGGGVLIRKDGTIAEGNFKNNLFDGGVSIRKPGGEMIVRANYKEGKLIDDQDVLISPDILKIAQEFFDSNYDSDRSFIDLNKASVRNKLRENYPSDLGWVVSNEVLKILLDRLDLKE